MTASASTTYNKPGIWLGGGTAGNLSEDAVFEMIQKMLHIFFQINNNVTDSDGLTVADFNEDATFSGNAS